MARPDHSTKCARDAAGVHAWEADPGASTRYRFVYACRCGAWAWSEGKRGKVHQYGPDSRCLADALAKKANRPLRPDTITAREHPGTNANGHTLPASATADRR